MTRLAFIATLIATTLHADDTRTWGHSLTDPDPAYVHIHAPQVSYAVATVTFQNRTTHNGDDLFDLTYVGITVSVHLDFNVDALGAERITVRPPDGYIARPESITVGEGDLDVIHIIEYLGG